jgi:tetratricopeptide (TPR) repeat protein
LYLWQDDGLLAEGLYWVELALAASDGLDIEPQARIRAHFQGGMFSRRIGDLDRAELHHRQGLILAQQGDVPHHLYMARWGLGTLARDRGDYAGARMWLSDAYDPERGNAWSLAEALTNLADTLNRTGEFAEAADLCRQALAICREHQPGPTRDGEALAELAHATWGLGDLSSARAQAEESLDVFRRIDNGWGCALALSMLGRVAHAQGDLDWAIAAWTSSLEHYFAARERIRVAGCLEGLAHLACDHEEMSLAVTLLGAAGALRATIGTPCPPADLPAIQRTLDVARATLGQDELDRQRSAGAALPLAAVVTAALALAQR